MRNFELRMMRATTPAERGVYAASGRGANGASEPPWAHARGSGLETALHARGSAAAER